MHGVQFYRQFLTQTNSKLFSNVQTYPQDPYQKIRMVMVLNHFSLASAYSIAVLGLGLFIKIKGWSWSPANCSGSTYPSGVLRAVRWTGAIYSAKIVRKNTRNLLVQPSSPNGPKLWWRQPSLNVFFRDLLKIFFSIYRIYFSPFIEYFFSPFIYWIYFQPAPVTPEGDFYPVTPAPSAAHVTSNIR